MTATNIFGGIGFLTDVQRKATIEHQCSNMTFKTCADLTEPIVVTAINPDNTIMPIDAYSRNVCEFINWWSVNVMPDLNGFSGFSNVKFELTFDIMSYEKIAVHTCKQLLSNTAMHLAM